MAGLLLFCRLDPQCAADGVGESLVPVEVDPGAAVSAVLAELQRVGAVHGDPVLQWQGDRLAPSDLLADIGVCPQSTLCVLPEPWCIEAVTHYVVELLEVQNDREQTLSDLYDFISGRDSYSGAVKELKSITYCDAEEVDHVVKVLKRSALPEGVVFVVRESFSQSEVDKVLDQWLQAAEGVIICPDAKRLPPPVWHQASLVVHFTMANTPEDYKRRTGRGFDTGPDARCNVLLFCNQQDRKKVAEIEDACGVKIPELPDGFEPEWIVRLKPPYRQDALHDD
eukprot:Hpha_TRINITY_DN5751_c0_g1::TRINITY_DN5751_c0_g1_i2::g.147650::m.147650